jgi:hypothetical protein
MAVRAAIALSLAALAWAALPWAGSAQAQDDPRCAQYREPMEYNACLARQGPKANGVGQLHGGAQPARAAPKRVWYGHSRGAPSTRVSVAPSTRFYDTQGSQRIHGRVHMEFRVH